MGLKILVINKINSKESGKKDGGSRGFQRNIELLKKCFDDENIIQYDIYSYSTKIHTFFYSLIGYSDGLTPKIQRNIKKIIIENQLDYLFLNSSKYGVLAKYLKKYIDVITFFHNIEFRYILQFIKNCFILKGVLYIPALITAFNMEKKAIKYSRKIITLNKRDSDGLLKLYHRSADVILPLFFYDVYNDYKAQKYNNTASKENTLLFVGVDIFTNTTGIFWFIENCLDHIQAKLIIVGNGMDKYKNKYPGKNVSFVGYIEDIADYYYDADVVISPILTGSGMKTKTCEALMYGKTIFGTSESFEGYDKIDLKENDWLCNTPDDFIVKINTYLNNKKTKINHYSREIFIVHYSNTAAEKIILQSL